MRLSLALLFAASSLMFGDTVYNESVSGDLSSDWTAPTLLSFGLGSNQVLGTTNSTDRDYFSFNVPAGDYIAAINVLPGTMGGGTGVSFFGLGSGGSFLPPTTAQTTLAASLLGYTLYGSGDVGSNILPRLAASNTSTPPAQGFTSLGAGEYSIWIQEGAAGSFPYGFDLVITPEPVSWPACCVALGLVILARRRSRLLS